MKEKIRSTKCWVIFWLLSGISNYCIFSFDLEKDKDYLYGWLLWTIISFCMFIIQGVKLEILRSKL